MVRILDHVDMLIADTVGLPGQREFYIQARKDRTVVAFLLEKAQVAILAERLQGILDRLATHRPEDAAAVGSLQAALRLDLPVESEFRVVRIGVGYDGDTDRVLLELWGGEDGPEDHFRITVTRERARAFARHGARVCSAGRPQCVLCGQPLDEAPPPGRTGHAGCPALN